MSIMKRKCIHRMKKGQITLFLIIGILLLLLVSMFFLIRAKISGEKVAVEAEEAAESADMLMLRNLVAGCLQRVTLEGIRAVSRNGGYYRIPMRAPFLEEALYPYHFYNGTLYPVTRDSVAAELQSYIDFNLPSCTNTPAVLSSFGFNVTAEPYQMDVIMGDRDVSVKLFYPLTIHRGERKEKTESFRYQSPQIPLGAIIDASQEYLESQKPFVFDFCYTCLFRAFDAHEVDAKTDIVPVTNFSYVINVKDDKAMMGGKPFIFQFAVRLFDPCGLLPEDTLMAGDCPYAGTAEEGATEGAGEGAKEAAG